MTSSNRFVFGLFLALTVTSQIAVAEVFQWKDANGQTIVSDSPPPSTAKHRRSIGGTSPAIVTEATPDKTTDAGKPPADAPKTAAEKEMDFRKRQQETREKAEKQAKDQAADAAKRDNCERARRNLAALEADQPMVGFDENGQRKVLDTTQRAAEMERARRVMADSCQ